ncbi:hypothetical protein [Flavobacterium sp. UGB4466]|uniref:hypothetical protein n=1 Tax=Flavobacterium sp. UGB4466 TaxID=2730889 RepID=UPI00192CBFED|nr:hypothetical protein [Flavobacterium sp. UGB4466]
MTNRLIINFSQETVEVLNKGNYSLCCFLASRSRNVSQFRPLCWSVTKNFLRSVMIEWEYRLSAYASTSEIIENQTIYIPQPETDRLMSRSTSRSSIGGTNYKIELKQRLLIQDFGAMSVDTNNDNSTVLIQNDSGTVYATGICIYSSNDGQYYGSCTFKTFGKQNIEVAPDNKAFLMFSDNNPQNNTVMLISQSPGILVDFDLMNDSRIVTFDVDKGWSSNEEAWGKQYPAGTNLQTLLIS